MDHTPIPEEPDMPPVYPSTPIAPAYTTADTVFAWLCFVFGYLFCRALPITESPLGGFLFVLALYITTFVILKIKKVRISAGCLLSGISAVVISAALILTENDFLIRLAFAYAIATYCYFIYAAFGNAVEKGFSDFVFTDYFKAMFVLPFRSLKCIFAATSNKAAKKGTQILLKILLGAVIAIWPTVFVFAFLSYDEGFMSILEDLFSFDFSDVGSHIVSLLIAIPIGMYIFGLFASSSRQLMQYRFTADSCRKRLGAMKILPQITALSAVLPILFLYVVFFISQWQYYISGFTGVLPADLSYAEYARQGFFQLCYVSVINLILIVVIVLFIQRGAKNNAPVLKLLTVVFCIFTLILISTAVAKLIMYIDFYGLTQKRIYAMWLMAVIAIVYVVIAVGQFVPKIKIVATSVSVCVALFAALSLCNVNTVIAEYNVNRYMAGTLETVDMYAMEQLGDSAIPTLVRLAEDMRDGDNASRYPAELQEAVASVLQEKAERIQNTESDIFAFTIPSCRAENALKAYGLLEP